VSISSSGRGTQAGRARRAGAFDIRIVIAALFGVVGLILTGMGLFGTSDADLQKSDGMNINLWTGLGLLAAAVLFALWTWLRPVIVDTEAAAGGERD
jgi:phosphate/sulfate permease